MAGIRHKSRLIQAAGLMLALVGYFGAWIPHKTAALTITGAELAEWARFFPKPEGRELLYLPLIAVFLLLTVQAGRSTCPSIRIGVPLALIFVLLTLLLPYTVLESLLRSLAARMPPVITPEYRGQVTLLIVTAMLMLIAPRGTRLPPYVRGALSALLGLGGIIPALWRFVPLRAHIAALYGSGGRTIVPGWGLVTCTAGFVLFVAGAMAEAKASGS